jgi:heme-binding NEAT domain protein
VLKTPKQEGDLKGTVQYERQQFISGSTDTETDLIGSTFAATYILHTKMLTYTRGLAFIPAYNIPRAYSANETDTIAFPTFKNLSFSVGTNDSYLNNPPISLPPTKRNSFQFTMGLTYAIKPRD